MKKVFQIKLKNITRVFALVVAASLVTFTGCKSYDEDITGLQGQIDKVVTDVAGLKTSVAALQTSVSGMTYIKSITMGTDGKLTITPSTGAAIVYDAKTYVTYDIALTNNVLTVNGVNKGTVAIPALTFADGVLKSGTSTVADLTSWLKSGLTVVDGMLAINGQKTSVAISVPAGKSVKDVTLVGNNVTVSYTDGSASTTFVNDAPIVATTGANGNLFVNGVDTGVMVKNTFAVSADGFLTVNGVKTTVAIPAENKSTVIINKDGSGAVVSATIGDGKDSFTVKVNPTNELLSSILFVPEWIDGGVNAVEVGYIMDIPTAPALSVKALFTQQNINFRFNPTTADVSKTTWKYVNNAAMLTVSGASNAPGDATTLFAAPTYTSNNDGSGKFTLKVGTWVEPAAGKTHLFALQANGKDFYSDANSQVVSDYVKVKTAPYTALIRNKVKSTVSATGVVTPLNNYSLTVPNVSFINVYDHEIVKGSQIDLNTLVLATATSGLAVEKTFEASNFGTLGVDYNFEYSLPVYKGTDTFTDQNSILFVTLTNNILKANSTPAPGDRTPLVLVKLRSAAGNLLAQAYIKFKIVDVPTIPGGIVTLPVTAVTYNYSALFVDAAPGVTGGDFKQIAVSWDEVNAKVYNPLGLTHNQFQTKYGAAPMTVKATVNGVNDAAATLVKYPLNRSILGPDVDTYAMTYNITPLAKFGTTVLTYTIDTGVATDNKVVIVITYTVNKPVLDKTILDGYRYNGLANEVVTQGMNAGANYLMQLYLGEAFSFGTSTYRNVFGSGVANKIDDATHTFAFKTTVPVQTGAQLTPAAGGTINQAFGQSTATTSGQLMDLTVKLTTLERVYDMQLITTYPNTETDVFDFKVHFMNPFTIDLDPAANFTLIDKVNGTADTRDIKTNYIVKFKGKKIVTQGVAETTNSATTVVATDFVDITNAAYGLFYQLTPGTQYFTISKAGGNAYNKLSMLTWDNSGTQLQSQQKVATVTVQFKSSFAEITKAADDVNVKPE